MNYDYEHLGVYNSMHPANEIEVEGEEVEVISNLTEAYECGHELQFILIQKELQREVEMLLDILTPEHGMYRKVKEIRSKLD